MCVAKLDKISDKQIVVLSGPLNSLTIIFRSDIIVYK